MMWLSMLNYQADEYMEAVVGKYYGGEKGEVENMIMSLFETEDDLDESYGSSEGADTAVPAGEPEKVPEAESGIAIPAAVSITQKQSTLPEQAPGMEDPENQAKAPQTIPSKNEAHLEETSSEHDETKSDDSGYDSLKASTEIKDGEVAKQPLIPTLQEVSQPLRRFVRHVLHHPKILLSSAYDQLRLKRELQIFLLAHVAQESDNGRFSRQQLPSDKSVPFETAESSYFKWVQSTSANHTSCPFAYAFVSCLLSASDGTDCFRSAHEKYVAEDLCRHLAVTCRQYNDYGSLARDRDEKNINSINFPEFFWRGDKTSDQGLKDELYAVAMYDKMKLDLAIGQLENLLRGRKRGALADAVKMFVNVTDTYGQIYIIRDIASRM
jgi:hypothetical protein